MAAIFFAGCTPPGPKSLLEGEALIKQGKHAQAIEKLRMATELLPANAQAWNHLGLAYHGAGQTAAAVKAYQTAIQRDPNLSVVFFNLGSLYLEQDLAANAASEFTKVTLLRNDIPEVWRKLGLAQWKLRQYEAAEKSFAKALEINPKDAEALNGMGLAHLQKRRIRDAGSAFMAATAAQPGYAPALLNQAILIHQLNNRTLALQKYRDYLAAAPGAANAGEVRAIVAALDAEAQAALVRSQTPTNPPPAAAAATNPPPRPPVVAAAAPTNTPLPAARNAPTNELRRPAATNMARVPAPAPVSAAPTNQAASVSRPAPPATNAVVSRPPSVTNPPPEKAAPAAVATEVVKVEEEPPPPRIAADPIVVPAAEPLREEPPAAVAQAEPAPAEQELRIIRPPEKKGVMERLNPMSWFRKDKDEEMPAQPSSRAASAAASSLPPVTLQSQPAPSTAGLPADRRYFYRSPAVPSPGNRAAADRLFAQALEAHRSRRLGEAAGLYRRAIEADPSYYEAHYNLGLATFDLKQYGESLGAYETALAVNPASIDARYNFALALEASGHYRDAVNELEQLLTVSAREARAHLSAAHLYSEALGRTDQARMHYRKVLELEPQHPQASAIRYWLAAHE